MTSVKKSYQVVRTTNGFAHYLLCNVHKKNPDQICFRWICKNKMCPFAYLVCVSTKISLKIFILKIWN